jgi:acetyl esterase/lipase
MPDAVPDGMRLTSGVVYGRGGDAELLMDIYRPERPAGPRVPAVVYIHGGAWVSGSRAESWVAPKLALFTTRGWVAASIDYRLSSVARWPAQIHDCKCAVRFLGAHAADYGIDPERIGAWGDSAGGHLAAMLGVSAGVREFEGRGGWAGSSSRVGAVCAWFAPSDFLSMPGQPSKIDRSKPDCPEAMLIGGPLAEKPDVARAASPVTHVGPESAPFIIMHGIDDEVVPVEQSRILHRALTGAGVESTLRLFEKTGHGGGWPAFQSPATKAEVLAFFERHIG